VKVALAGCGVMGSRRTAALGPDRLTACYDVDSEAAKALADETGAAACDSFDDLLAASPDAVLVATSHDALADLAARALAGGVNVLVEKPGARNAEELLAVAEAAASAGRFLHVGFNHRFHPGIARGAEEALSGAHGEIMYVRGRYGHGGRLGYEDEWRARPELSGGGELMDQGMHLLDLSHWLFGPLPLHSALLRTNFWPVAVEDNAVLVLGETGEIHAPWSTLHVSWTEWKNDFALEIYCKRAKLQVTGLWGSYGPQVLRVYRMGPTLGPPDVEVLEYGDEDRSWAAEWEYFRAAVQEDRETDVGSALYALRTIEEAYRLSGYGTPAAAR
jgi:predicted dehydrogenase